MCIIDQRSVNEINIAIDGPGSQLFGKVCQFERQISRKSANPDIGSQGRKASQLWMVE